MSGGDEVAGHTRRAAGEGRRAWLPMRPLRDIGLFMRSARSDAKLHRLRTEGEGVGLREREEEAFSRLYAEAPEGDPWASASPRYAYQRRKYDRLEAFLPAGRRFRSALDLGCGLGLFTERLATRADIVVGADIAEPALERARRRLALRGIENARFERADLRALPKAWEGAFDLIIVADVLYYLPTARLRDEGLKEIAASLARLLAPGGEGLLVLANHDFLGCDHDTRLTRRIHAAFRWTPGLDLLKERRFAFFRASALHRPTASP